MSTTPRNRKAAEASAELQHEAVASRVETAFRAAAPAFNASLATFAELIAHWNQHQGFWQSDNTGEKIALMHSELSEALEADRKDLPSEHLGEDFSGLEEELADVIIRVLDFAGYHQLDLAGALQAKLHYNLTRPFKHGKGY